MRSELSESARVVYRQPRAQRPLAPRLLLIAFACPSNFLGSRDAWNAFRLHGKSRFGWLC